MKFNGEKLMRAKKTVDLVNSCSISINQAIAVALASVGGKVYDVKAKEMNQQVVWRVKLVRSDERVKVYIDALSGKIIEARAEQSRKMGPETTPFAMSKRYAPSLVSTKNEDKNLHSAQMSSS
jgi:hypothetical protein